MSNWRDHYYRSDDGLRLYCRDYAGRGAIPVLCLHGLTRNSADFGALAGQLAPCWRVLAPDVRGRGRSEYDPHWQNYQPKVYVDDTWRLLDDLAIEQAVLIGTSMGGLMAMLMAVQQPRRIAALVLNDIGPEVDPAGIARIISSVSELAPVATWDEAAAQSRQGNGDAFPDFDDADWLAFARRTWREDGDTVRPDFDLAIANAFAEANTSADLWPVFAEITQPMLVVRGERSDILTPATSARMQREHSNCNAVVVPRRGHAPVLDEPLAVDAIKRVLDRIGAN